MTPQQIAVAAELLRMEVGVATSRAHEMRDGIVMVASDVRGVGSVLVGPDLSVLFFVSSISPDRALEVWDTGRRTPIESSRRCMAAGERADGVLLRPADPAKRRVATRPGRRCVR